MIVISHSWEFVPKGSSHFSYHINSLKSSSSSGNSGNSGGNINSKQATNDTNVCLRNKNINILNNKNRVIGAALAGLNLDENRSINESYNLLTKLVLDNGSHHHHHECQNVSLEKWHLKQQDEYIENEIYIKDSTVILSNGSDFESKIVDKCYSYDSPVIDCNWFNFRGGLSDSDIINDALCVFELQKLHIYFPNGSDFHINLSFKIKNCWKLRDGILIEKIPDSDSVLTNPFSKSKPSNPVLFSLSHPLNELKPVMHKSTLDSCVKATYWKENNKHVIIDVIESLDLLLAYNQANGAHYLYRISDVIIEEEDVDIEHTPKPTLSQTLNSKTPLNRTNSASCLSMNLHQSSKRRLSVSPIVTNFQNRFNVHTPAITITNSSASSASLITSRESNVLTLPNNGNNVASLHPHHVAHHNLNHIHTHRTFSPMAALSRSPSCSSSPAILSLATTGNHHPGHRRSLIPLPMTTAATTINNTSIINTNNPLTTFMTPSVDHCKTPITNHMQQTPFNNGGANRGQYTTPLCGNTDTTLIDSSTDNEPIAEYMLEYIWHELIEQNPNEKATKFFYASDLYSQKYVCYVLQSRSQLRCLKVDYNSENQIVPVGTVSTINNVKDAVFIETRNLTVVLDNLGNLIVYSGLSKLSRVHIHNLVSTKTPSNAKIVNNVSIRSPVVSPPKVKLANLIDEESSLSSNEPENTNSSIDVGTITIGASKLKQQQQQNALFTLPSQNEFKAVFDSTGSRFSIKLNDNRLIRLSINEITTCKLVKMCLEAFKLTLKKDIFYEIIQQWFIHRYTVSESLSDQLNLFLYLIVNLCGCFDMKRLENEMKFLFSFNNGTSTSKTTSLNDQQRRLQQLFQHQFDDQSERLEDTLLDYSNNISDSTASIDNLTANSKRVKCNETTQLGTDDDWEFLLNHELIQNNASLNSEFSFLKANTIAKSKSRYQNHRTSNSQRLSSTASSSGSSTNTSGILYPFLKHILYTLHLVYEEAKLYRSLKFYMKNFIQILYLFSLELNLPHYSAYYENECPFLLGLKANITNSPPVPSVQIIPPQLSSQNRQSVGNAKEPNMLMQQLTPQAASSSNNTTQQQATTAFANLRAKSSPSSHIAYIISQEPPNLMKFLFKLIECPLYEQSRSANDEALFEKFRNKPTTSIQNPFPILTNVSVRTIHAIKVYALTSLACKINNKMRYKDYLNQLMLKINLTGFTTQQTETEVLAQLQNSNNKLDIYKNLFQLCIYDMNIKIIDDLYDYPYFILFPIFEALYFARESPSLEWPIHAFNLISRFDLEILKAIKSSESNQEQNDRIKSLSIGGEANAAENNELIIQVRQNLKKEDEDGMQHVGELEAYKCRFNDDLRLNEVRSCLQTTRSIQIKLTQGPDVSDHDFVEEEEKFLYCVCQRTMALPIGRGILTLHTVNPIPTEPVTIPDLNLKGKSLTKKTTIDLTRIEVPVNLTYWPLFHNGVAAGLTIDSQSNDLSNAWIKSHLAKNFELTNEQAGFLYGLGLTGHLSSLSMLNVHDALTRRHDLTNISILLGLASSKICSMDINVIRLISMHIRALMPPVEIELEIPYNIQIAALLSLGLVYAKSANKHISYVLLKEIGRLPNSELDKDVHTFDREAYSLSAGLALGLVLLEKGKESLTIMDSMFTDELYHYMVGGHKERSSDGIFGATGFGMANGHGRMNANNNNNNQNNNNNNNNNNDHVANSSINVNGSANGINFINYSKNANSSHIREGESININVTSPGATLALGLIYFNSGDKSIAEWFSSPDSIYLLDSIRPDFLLLRTLARNLIMWKYILPTKQWVNSQLPNILRKTFKSELSLKKKFSKLNMRDNDENNNNGNDSGDDDEFSANYNEMDTKLEAFQHIIAGACMSVALKFAGSCNNDAYQTLLYWARYFTDLNDTKLSTENCLCVVVLSLAVLMAGSGDLEVLRICRYLRSRVGPTYTHVLYGSHMAINMALALLFMGGGRYALKTDSLSVALMICAFYPHFPIDSNDNRFHLQAFRHLYVLSSESRLLLTKDVDSNSFCYVPIEITLKQTEHHELFKYTQMAPCLLPELDKVQELKVLGPRYYSIKFSEELSFLDLKNILTSQLYVKQKNGYFSYSDDPKDEKAFNIRNFLSKTIVPRHITPELLENITNEEYINLFAKVLNKSNDSNEFDERTNRLLKIMYESVIQETFDFVGIILQLDKEVNEDPLNSFFISEMILINAFYRLIPSKKNQILCKEFLISLTNTLETRIRNKINNKNLIESYLNGDYIENTDNVIHFCVYYDINKAELAHFKTCNSMTDLLKIPSNNIRIEKILFLYQTLHKTN